METGGHGRLENAVAKRVLEDLQNFTDVRTEINYIKKHGRLENVAGKCLLENLENWKGVYTGGHEGL